MVVNLQNELDMALEAKQRILTKGQSTTYSSGDGVVRVELAQLEKIIDKLKMSIEIQKYPIF